MASSRSNLSSGARRVRRGLVVLRKLSVPLLLAGLLTAKAFDAHAAEMNVPASLARPGDEIVLALTGAGEQVYECKADASGALTWSFAYPQALLRQDGRIAIVHGAGPRWEHVDGSAIAGKVLVKEPAPNAADIPWLRLTATDAAAGAEGALSGVTAILRLDTKGGTLSGPCAEAGTLKAAPYSARYVFLRSKS